MLILAPIFVDVDLGISTIIGDIGINISIITINISINAIIAAINAIIAAIIASIIGGGGINAIIVEDAININIAGNNGINTAQKLPFYL